MWDIGGIGEIQEGGKGRTHLDVQQRALAQVWGHPDACVKKKERYKRVRDKDEGQRCTETSIWRDKGTKSGGGRGTEVWRKSNLPPSRSNRPVEDPERNGEAVEQSWFPGDL